MEKNSKGSSYVGFALICIILGSILITIGSFIKHDIKSNSNDFIEITAKVISYDQLNGDKVNVICKYGYDKSEYNYVCHTAKKEEALEKYKIGSEEKIKINKSNPGRISAIDLNYVIIAIYSIGMIFFIMAIFYMINEVIRLLKRSKTFAESEESNE